MSYEINRSWSLQDPLDNPNLLYDENEMVRVRKYSTFHTKASEKKLEIEEKEGSEEAIE